MKTTACTDLCKNLYHNPESFWSGYTVASFVKDSGSLLWEIKIMLI